MNEHRQLDRWDYSASNDPMGDPRNKGEHVLSRKITSLHHCVPTSSRPTAQRKDYKGAHNCMRVEVPLPSNSTSNRMRITLLPNPGLSSISNLRCSAGYYAFQGKRIA